MIPDVISYRFNCKVYWSRFGQPGDLFEGAF